MKKDLLDTIQGRVIDQSAYTLSEIAEKKGLTRAYVGELIAINLKSGAWEQVWKRASTGKTVRAYRLTKK